MSWGCLWSNCYPLSGSAFRSSSICDSIFLRHFWRYWRRMIISALWNSRWETYSVACRTQHEVTLSVFNRSVICLLWAGPVWKTLTKWHNDSNHRRSLATVTANNSVTASLHRTLSGRGQWSYRQNSVIHCDRCWNYRSKCRLQVYYVENVDVRFCNSKELDKTVINSLS